MRRILVAAILAAAACVSGCSTTGGNHLKCSSTEIAPNTQPGSDGPEAALQWFLKHGDHDLPRTGFSLTSHSRTRYIYANGRKQVSVEALPAEEGKPRIWVVLMTFDCS